MKGFSLVIRYLLILVLAISIIVFTFLNVASNTVLTKDYVMSKLEDNGYYEKVYEELKTTFENSTEKLPVEGVDLSDLILEDQIKDQARQMVSNIFDGTDAVADVEEMRVNVTARINEAVANEKIKLSAADEGTIETYTNKICDEYSNAVNQTESMQNIRNIYTKVLTLVELVKKGLLITMLVTLLLILGICYRRIFKVLSSAGVALMLSGLVDVGSKFLVESNQAMLIEKINNILNLGNETTNVMQNIISDFMQKIMVNGAILLGIGIILIGLGTLIDRYRNREE